MPFNSGIRVAAVNPNEWNIGSGFITVSAGDNMPAAWM